MGKTRECLHCGRVMLRKNLLRHIQERHRDPDALRWHLCTVAGCSYRTTRERDLKRHVRGRNCPYPSPTSLEINEELPAWELDVPTLAKPVTSPEELLPTDVCALAAPVPATCRSVGLQRMDTSTGELPPLEEGATSWSASQFLDISLLLEESGGSSASGH